jgi:hypothetical protein
VEFNHLEDAKKANGIRAGHFSKILLKIQNEKSYEKHNVNWE